MIRFHGHYMKYLAELHELLYFCSLCNFQCLEKKQLIDHIYAYKLHRHMAQDKSILDSTPYLHESHKPYVVQLSHYRVLPQEESFQLFKRLYEQGQIQFSSQISSRQLQPTQDLLCQALEASIPRSDLEADVEFDQRPGQAMFNRQSFTQVGLPEQLSRIIASSLGLSVSQLPGPVIQRLQNNHAIGPWSSTPFQAALSPRLSMQSMSPFRLRHQGQGYQPSPMPKHSLCLMS